MTDAPRILRLKSGLEARVETVPEKAKLPDRAVVVVPGTLQGTKTLRSFYTTMVYRLSLKDQMFSNMSADMCYKILRDRPYDSLDQVQTQFDIYRVMYGLARNNDNMKQAGFELPKPISIVLIPNPEMSPTVKVMSDFFNAYMLAYLKEHPNLMRRNKRHIDSYIQKEQDAGRMNGEDLDFVFMFNEEPDMLSRYAEIAELKEDTVKLLFVE